MTNCGGGGSCGTCVVNVSNNPDWEVRAEWEGKRLKKYGKESRLSCQTVIEGDCSIEIKPNKI
jgi:ferredoxin